MPTDLYFVVLTLFIVAGILNIYQYCIICGLQDRVDNTEDALDQSRKEGAQLKADLHHARLEIEHQRSLAGAMPKVIQRSDRLFAKIEEARAEQMQPIDHVHAAVMVGHTGLMAEAQTQYHAEQKKRVDEQRRLEKSKHVGIDALAKQDPTAMRAHVEFVPDVDSYSHAQAQNQAALAENHALPKDVLMVSNPSSASWVSGWFKTESEPNVATGDPVDWRTQHEQAACATPIDHSPSSHQDHALFSCDTPSSDAGSNPSDF